MELNAIYCLGLSNSKISPPQILNALNRVVMNRTSQIRVKMCWFWCIRSSVSYTWELLPCDFPHKNKHKKEIPLLTADNFSAAREILSLTRNSNMHYLALKSPPLDLTLSRMIHSTFWYVTLLRSVRIIHTPLFLWDLPLNVVRF